MSNPLSTAMTVPDSIVNKVIQEVDNQSDDIVALLQDLVRFPSENPKLTGQESDGEARLQEYVATVLENIGANVDKYEPLPGRPNVLGTIAGTADGRSLVLNGHIDVVPAGNHDDWSYPPFGAEIHNGNVYGRGALDMKGGVTAMLSAARVLKQLGLQPKGDVQLQTVIDEETGGLGTRAAIERGFKPDFALVVEPTNDLAIQPVEGGLEWLRMTVTGVSGHSAYRYKSVHAGGQGIAKSAFDRALKLINGIADLERMWANRKVHPLLPKGITTINVGAIAAGTGGGQNGMPNIMTSVSALPDYCAVDLSLKYLPSENTEEVRAEFEEFIYHLCQADDWLRDNPPTIEWGLHGVSFPPADTPVDHPAVQALQSSAEAAGIESQVTGFHAVSDIAWFAGEGIPTALFGPGIGDGAHGLNEHVSIESVLDVTKALALFILNWCGYEELSSEAQ